MTKWEYLVVGPVEGGDYNIVIGYTMNDKKVLFKKKRGATSNTDFNRNTKDYQRWHSPGNYLLLNHLGGEGWELIKSSGPYLFKRPLK